MVASIGKIALPAQGVGCFDKDGCYAKDNPHLAARATLMTRAPKRDIDRDAFARSRQCQAAALGFGDSGS